MKNTIKLILIFSFLFLPRLSFAGKLNKERIAEEEDPKPPAVSQAYWSANTYAAADSVSTAIGSSMLKWGIGLSVVFAILCLIFSQGEDGGGGAHTHTHGHL
jgi:hypothetical protein